MSRPVTLFTGQWADLDLEVLCQKVSSWGYDGIELPCWGGHFDVQRALKEPDYCQARHDLLAKYGLKCWAISCHLTGQLTCDILDERTDPWVPAEVRGDSEKKRAWAIQEIKDTARAAAKFGVKVVNGFTGSSIWHLLYSFPPVPQAMLDAGYHQFAEIWNPILDVFDEVGVKFGLEVHPTEIAYDIYSTHQTLEAINHRMAFGFNFDPSHLLWQFVDPVAFLREFPDRIYHVHVKDAARTLDGKTGILASHLNFGDHRRGWDFRSPGRGQVDFEAITRELNRLRYTGPLSVEWEDCGMDREYGAEEACQFVKKTMGFRDAGGVFDEAFGEAQNK